MNRLAFIGLSCAPRRTYGHASKYPTVGEDLRISAQKYYIRLPKILRAKSDRPV